MNLSQNEVAKGLYDELMAVIDKYADIFLVATVVGILEMVKSDIMDAALLDDDEEEDDADL